MKNMKKTLRLPAVTVTDPKGNKKRLVPFENYIPLEEVVEFSLRGRQVGAYLTTLANRTVFKFTFGFESTGIHCNLTYDEMEPFFDAIADGLKDFPKDQYLKIWFSSYTSDRERQLELSEVAHQSPRPIQYILLAEKKRLAELTNEGIRKPKRLRLFVTCQFTQESANTSDWIERSLARLSAFFQKVSDVSSEVMYLHYLNMFESAFNDCFLKWEQLLKVKMKLDVKVLTAQQMWEVFYQSFNSDDAPHLPQYLVYDGTTIRSVHNNSELHLSSLVLKQQQSVPVPDRRYVYLPSRKQYCAPVIFSEKPAGWKDKQHQLSYIWSIFARDPVTDVDYVCEISRANEAIVKENISRVVRQAYSSQIYSAKHNQIDVSASYKQQKAMEAQEALLAGEVPLNVACAFLIYRKDLTGLESAIRYIQNCIPRPAWLDWEQEYAWKVWLQAQPFSAEPFLLNPFNRRLVYSNEEAPAFLALIRPSPLDKVGTEFITDEGGVPLNLDLYRQHRNIAFFATTRSGKSVTISHIIVRALAENIPVILMDFPPSDEASTFKDLTYYLEGAYFDIGSEASNLLEPPDLRQFPEEKRKERMEEFLDFVASSLLIMCYGSGTPTNSSDKLLRQSIRALLTPAVNYFYADEEIASRFERAIAAGIGTPEWERIPTLVDFVNWLEQKGFPRLTEEIGNDSGTQQAIGQIRRQLRFWLNSRVGAAISRPSTFRSDAKLLVFALRGLGDNDDAALLALSAYASAIRRTLSYPKSIFFIDEFSVLLEWSEIANLVARFTANGAKAGIRVILAAQDPNTLANNAAGPKIIQNLSTILIGRIKPNAIDSFVDILKIDREIIARNASEAFYPSKEGLYSQWLLEDQNKRTFVRYYSPPYLLAVVANNPHESLCRRAWMKKLGMYPGIERFAEELVSSIRRGHELRYPELTEEEMVTIQAEEEAERQKVLSGNQTQALTTEHEADTAPLTTPVTSLPSQAVANADSVHSVGSVSEERSSAWWFVVFLVNFFRMIFSFVLFPYKLFIGFRLWFKPFKANKPKDKVQELESSHVLTSGGVN